MRDYFKKLSEILFNRLVGNEILILNFEAEQTDFIRFNHSKIRQAGNVKQATLTLNLVKFKNKTLTSVMRLNLDLDRDTKLLERTLNFLRREIPELHEDPYLMYERNINSTENNENNNKLDSKEITENIITSFSSTDMVGILASGSIIKSFANSLGQFNWHENYSFNFDWSMYTESGKAVKQNYSNQRWNQDTFKKLLIECKQKLEVIDNKEELIKPGDYKVYLSPSALNEIIEMLSWGGFVDCTINTSSLRMFSLNAILISPSLKLWRSIFPKSIFK